MKKWVIILIILVIAVNIGIIIWGWGDSTKNNEGGINGSESEELAILLGEATEANAFKEVQLNPFDDA